MDFREWGAAQQLTQETISILIDNGVDSRTALAALTAEDLPALGLKLGQMALVRRLINAEPTASTTTGAPAPPTALSIVRTLQVCEFHNRLPSYLAIAIIYSYFIFAPILVCVTWAIAGFEQRRCYLREIVGHAHFHTPRLLLDNAHNRSLIRHRATCVLL